jgi:hypothetical protein
MYLYKLRNKIKQLIEWAVIQPWPIHVFFISIIIHIAFRSNLEEKQRIDLIFSILFQMTGSFIVLRQILSKIPTIINILKEWISLNHLLLEQKNISLEAFFTAHSKIGISGLKKEFHDKIEDKIKYIEEKLYELDNKTKEQYKDLLDFIEKKESILMTQIEENYNKTIEANNKIRVMTRTAGLP